MDLLIFIYFGGVQNNYKKFEFDIVMYEVYKYIQYKVINFVFFVESGLLGCFVIQFVGGEQWILVGVLFVGVIYENEVSLVIVG